jgi:hypothetical protein
MKDEMLKCKGKRASIVAACCAALMAATLIGGCAAYDPQGAAQQYAPNYYNQSYDQLSAQQKMQLENHLANQSNQAWRTTAQVTSSVGRLAQGAGILLFSARH